MPCYTPLAAYKTANGEVVFSELKRYGDIQRPIQLPCGQCLGCRLERARQWAVRCMHEATLHRQNAFITLTYSDEYIPKRASLDYDHYQRFMKRLRRRTGKPVRFYMCGEYGETTWRPHYHAVIFGHDWTDKKFHTRNGQGDNLYISDELQDTWGMGQCLVGEVNFKTAGYVARYCVQKRTGKGSELWYKRQDADGEYYLEPEFSHMSLKPGIGAAFMHKWADDIYNNDYVIVNGKETKPPKYYDRLLQRKHIWAYEDIKEAREAEAIPFRNDNTDERLKVKLEVKRAQLRALKRTI